jgi:uncharacterized protein (TIGR00369 family)
MAHRRLKPPLDQRARAHARPSTETVSMNLLADLPAGLTGLEQLQSMLEGGRGPSIGETLGFELVEVEEGRVVFAGTPGLHVYNPIGTVHGGYAATLLDSACGCAAHSRLGPNQGYTTLELKVAYHRPMTANTGLVRAEGRVLSMGRRAAFTEASITDAQGKLYASATSTLLVFER